MNNGYGNRRGIFSTVMAFLAFVFSLGAVVYGIKTYTLAQDTANIVNSGNYPLAPITDKQYDMLQQFRLATQAETYAVRSLPDLKDKPAAQHIYVATAAEFTLEYTEIPFLLIVPDGTRWTVGPQGNVTFLKIMGDTVNHDTITRNGALYDDPMCELKRLEVFVGDCTSAEANRAGNWDEMMRSMRRPTEAELKSFFEPKDHQNVSVEDYLIATKDFRVAPETRDWDTKGAVTGILVPEGIKVEGGQLGYIDIVVKPGVGTTDTICFLYANDDETGPRAFAPEAEIKRVQQTCANNW